jgi:hypothetical protein
MLDPEPNLVPLRQKVAVPIPVPQHRVPERCSQKLVQSLVPVLQLMTTSIIDYFQDIDFSVWGRENKPARLPNKPRPTGSEPAAVKKRRKLSPEKRSAQEVNTDAAGGGDPPSGGVAASPVFYVKFNFRRPKRKRQDSVVSVELQDVESQDASPTPSPSASPSPSPSPSKLEAGVDSGDEANEERSE